MHTVLDIETEPRPLEEIADLMPTFEAPTNFKDPEKIAANIEAQKQKWIADAALSPLTGRIVAIGYRSDASPVARLALTDLDEKDALIEFWAQAERPGLSFVGHNLYGFDLPFIVRRSWFHGIRVDYYRVFGARSYADSSRFIDTMKAFQAGNSKEQFIGLDRVARYFGLPGKTEDIGADFGKVLRSDAQRALAYLYRDLDTTHAIASRMGLI